VNLRTLLVMALGLVLAGNVCPGDGGGNGAAMEMVPVGFDGWKKALAETSGNITVVDLWASWCVPCIERFPNMVALYHTYRGRGVRFISLNFDESGDTESLQWANSFLQRVGAVFPNYHMDENMTSAFDRLDLVGLPAVLIYDAGGAEAYRLTADDPNRQFRHQDVENAVLTLLQQESAEH